MPVYKDACLPFSVDAYLPFWVDACSIKSVLQHLVSLNASCFARRFLWIRWLNSLLYSTCFYLRRCCPCPCGKTAEFSSKSPGWFEWFGPVQRRASCRRNRASTTIVVSGPPDILYSLCMRSLLHLISPGFGPTVKRALTPKSLDIDRVFFHISDLVLRLPNVIHFTPTCYNVQYSHHFSVIWLRLLSIRPCRVHVR